MGWLMMKGLKIVYKKDKGYGAIDRTERIGDAFRSVVGGRYKFIQDGDKVNVVKRYGLSIEDKPLKEKDFFGRFGRDNNRLVRRMDKYFRKTDKKGKTKPNRMSFYIDCDEGDSASVQDTVSYSGMMDTAARVFRRRNYTPETIPRFKKHAKIAKKIGKYGVPIGLIGGAALKFLGRQKGIDLDVPIELAQTKAVMDGVGNILLAAGAGAGVSGLYAMKLDKDLETYRNVRRNMKSVNISF
jgi:hypothetical protein